MPHFFDLSFDSVVSHLHPMKEKNVGLYSCLPVLCCKGRTCTCHSPMQSEGSAGTEELGMLRSVLNWKTPRSKPTTERIPEPAQCHRALLFSAQCIFATYSISLPHFSPALLDQGASLTWKEAVRDHSDLHSSALHAIHSWKGKAAWGGNLLACILSQCTAVYYSQGSRYCECGADLFHTMLLWGNHGLKWKHANRPAPLEGLNKY